MYLVKLEQEQAEREYQKEQEERRRRAQEAKRRKRFLDAAFDGDNDELLAILKEVGLDLFVCIFFNFDFLLKKITSGFRLVFQ